MKYIAFLIILSVAAFATNRTVKAGGGGDCTVIQTCVNLMAAGDTTTVFAGTYNENVTLTAGGVSNYKTLTVNGADVVSVLGFTLNSHVQLIGNCPAKQGTVTSAACGFFISNPSSPTTACVSLPNGTTDVFIRSNVMYACGGIGQGYPTNVSFVYIQGNTVSYTNVTTATVTTTCPTGAGVGNGVNLYGDHLLVENNDFSHYTLALNWNPQKSVTRNNNFHDANEINNSGNCHSDTWFSDPGGTNLVNNSFNVFEGNYQRNGIGPNAKGILLQAPACAGCTNAIVRFNVVAYIGSGNTSNNQNWANVKVYNNTCADCSYQAGAVNGNTDNSSDSNPPNPSFLNQLYYYSIPYTSINPYACGSTNNCNYGHSLAYCAAGCTTLYGHVYQVGTWLSDPGNQTANPNFVSYVSPGSLSNDYHLQASSPARGAGTFLTTVASGCNTSSLTLADASYFQDGFGLAGVQADWIRVGASTTGQISAVNYTTNVVTMTGSLSCTNGASVYLYRKSDGVLVLNAANPDIGAFAVALPAPPTGLSSVVH